MKYQYSNSRTQFQIVLFNANVSVLYHSLVCTQLNGFKYCYVSLIIQLNISYLFTQLNVLTVLFNTLTEPYRVLPIHVRVNLGVMAMKTYSTLTKTYGLNPHRQIV